MPGGAGSETWAGTDIRAGETVGGEPVREKTEAENGLADGAPQPAEQLIGELISQLDQDQALLVKVRAPQVELFGAFDALQTADPDNALAFDESATRDGSTTRALDEGVRSVRPLVVQQTDAAKPVESAIAAPTQIERESVENLSQQVLFLKGSADQIRQVLTDLAARPGVAIEPARSELDAVRQRWTEHAAHLEQQAEADDALARDTRDTKLARHSAEAASVKLRELVKQAGMFYIYFRLHPDTAPPKPAAPPDDH